MTQPAPLFVQVRVPYKKLIEDYAKQFFSEAMQCKTGDEIDVRFASASIVRGHNERCANEEKKNAEATSAANEAEVV